MLQKITSRENQKLKYARKVRDGKIADAIFIEGLRLAEEAVRSGLEIIECFADEKFGKNEREIVLFQQFAQFGNQINSVENKLFQTIADTKNSQGIVLIARKPDAVFHKIKVGKNHFVFLFEINNPSNLGAILRTSEAAGIGGVIVSKSSTDAFSPKSIRSSMGAAFRLPIWENAEFDEVLAWAKENELRTTAADIKGENSHWQTDWTKNRLLIFGSEADGLSENQLEKIDELIYIPMANEVESLNLAVSCGIILFEAKKNQK